MAVYQIYFSPTGGTRSVSEILASAWLETVNIDLSDPKAESLSKEFSEEDLCIFAVPAFEGRVPPVFLRRIQHFSGQKTPCVLVAVYGNRHINDTLLELEDAVLPLGFQPFAAVSAVAQHSVFPQFGTGRPDEADQTELKTYAQEIKTAYEKGIGATPVRVPGNRPYIVIKGVGFQLEFYEEKCIHCMQCAQQCPVSAIDSQDPGKVDRDACAHCMRCFTICPTQAWGIPASHNAVLERIGHLLEGRKENALYL